MVTLTLREAIADMLAENKCAAGDPGHYGVDVLNVSPTGSRFDLVLTFRAGRTYCCQEPGCQLGIYRRSWWGGIRSRLAAMGLRRPGLMRIGRLTTVVEAGARLTVNVQFGLPVEVTADDVAEGDGVSERAAKG